MTGVPSVDRQPLRDRLLALRADLRTRLESAEVVEPRWLAMLADCEVMLAALDREAP